MPSSTNRLERRRSESESATRNNSRVLVRAAQAPQRQRSQGHKRSRSDIQTPLRGPTFAPPKPDPVEDDDEEMILNLTQNCLEETAWRLCKDDRYVVIDALTDVVETIEAARSESSGSGSASERDSLSSYGSSRSESCLSSKQKRSMLGTLSKVVEVLEYAGTETDGHSFSSFTRSELDSEEEAFLLSQCYSDLRPGFSRQFQAPEYPPYAQYEDARLAYQTRADLPSMRSSRRNSCWM